MTLQRKGEAEQTITLEKNVRLRKSGAIVVVRYLYNDPQYQTDLTHHITSTGLPPLHIKENKVVQLKILDYNYQDNERMLVTKSNLKKALKQLDTELARINNLQDELDKARRESNESLKEFDEYSKYYDEVRSSNAHRDFPG
jgi:hypothetical protein